MKRSLLPISFFSLTLSTLLFFSPSSLKAQSDDPVDVPLINRVLESITQQVLQEARDSEKNLNIEDLSLVLDEDKTDPEKGDADATARATLSKSAWSEQSHQELSLRVATKITESTVVDGEKISNLLGTIEAASKTDTLALVRFATTRLLEEEDLEESIEDDSDRKALAAVRALTQVQSMDAFWLHLLALKQIALDEAIKDDKSDVELLNKIVITPVFDGIDLKAVKVSLSEPQFEDDFFDVAIDFGFSLDSQAVKTSLTVIDEMPEATYKDWVDLAVQYFKKVQNADKTEKEELASFLSGFLEHVNAIAEGNQDD